MSREALEQLYRRLEKPLYNVVYRWVWNREDARDLVQETFVRLWRMRARVRGETVEPLIYRIAMNLAANRRRSRRLWRWASLGAAGSRAAATADGQSVMESAEREASLRRAVERLPERLRRVILMCEFSGMTYREIGSVLGIPAGTVGSRRNEALKRLRKILEPLGVGGA
jgi:RNA polymerase sigma-70 factor (ECF subfamily)